VLFAGSKALKADRTQSGDRHCGPRRREGARVGGSVPARERRDGSCEASDA